MGCSQKQLARAIRHTAKLYGGLPGITRQTALPEIKTIELPEGDTLTTTSESDEP